MDDRNGALPRLSAKGADGVARASRCPASPRRAFLAENLGKPSLWVIITDPWYTPRYQSLYQGLLSSCLAHGAATSFPINR